jgi:hypothetical protein
MAKQKIKKVGIKMLEQGTEWVVSSPIPVYGWESLYVAVNGRSDYRKNPQKVQFRVIPIGANIQILSKGLYAGYFNINERVFKVQVIGEPDNELYIPLSDLLGRIAPTSKVGRFHVFCRNRQQYYLGVDSVLNDPTDYRKGYRKEQKWSNEVSNITFFTSLSAARTFALVHTGEAARNPQNSNCFTYHSGPEIELAGDLVIVRTHLLTNAVMDEHPVIA